MQHTLFIADLHLDENHPTSYALFKEFIHRHLTGADALYILGISLKSGLEMTIKLISIKKLNNCSDLFQNKCLSICFTAIATF